MPEKNSTDVTAGAKTIRLKMTTRGCVCMGVRACACAWPILCFLLRLQGRFPGNVRYRAGCVSGSWDRDPEYAKAGPSITLLLCIHVFPPPPSWPAFFSVKYGCGQDLYRSSFSSGSHSGFRVSSTSAPAVSGVTWKS